jgi:ABC-type multidrug transport system fused ATPase/permease subunit
MRLPSRPTQKLRSLQPLWQSLSPRRRRQLLGLQILSLAAAAGEVANLGALLPVLRLLANPTEGLKALGPLAAPLRMLPEPHLLLSLGLGFVLVVALSTTLRVFTIRAQLRLAALIAADLGEQVFAAVLQKPFPWHLRHNTSNVLGFLTKDVDQANGSIQALLVVVVNLAIVLLLGGSLIALAPGVMLVISALLAGFYLLVFRLTRGTLRADGQRLTSNYQSSLQVAQEGLGGIRDVLLDRSQPFFLEAYRGRNRSFRLAMAAINTKAQVPRYLIEGFAVVLIVGLALSLALRGQGIEQQLPLLGTLALGAYRLLQPLQQCFVALSSLQANQASLERLQPFLVRGTAPQPGAFQPLHALPSPTGEQPLLQLQQLSFRYSPEGPWVLRDLELAIQPGERIAFVGSTGSGKSTTSDLILGLLAPSQGRLLVHGQDLQATPGLVAAWQQRVSHVPQSIYLSDASFAANIAFGVPEAQIDHRRVRQAAEQAQIAELIENNNNGYDNIVGERGVRLSGGQRQRIGLARALYKQANLLVLDEATSALDNQTEAEVISVIEGLDRNMTIIIIAHRLSTVKMCERIVVFDHGTIKKIGIYEETIGSSGSL